MCSHGSRLETSTSLNELPGFVDNFTSGCHIYAFLLLTFTHMNQKFNILIVVVFVFAHDYNVQVGHLVSGPGWCCPWLCGKFGRLQHMRKFFFLSLSLSVSNVPHFQHRWWSSGAVTSTMSCLTRTETMLGGNPSKAGEVLD